LPKIWTAWVGRTNVTDDRQTTDGRAIAYSEREREFTFAKKQQCDAVQSEIKWTAEEWRLQPSLEDGQRWRRSDVRWQTVPNASCSDSESAVRDGDTTRWWNVQLERRSWTKSPSRVHVCHTAQFWCKVWRSHKHSELECDPLWDA